jgi:Tfp pilus assembly PilM family ATPase/Tfp pilus assembly protein PilN
LLYLEIRPRSLRLLHGEENLVIPLERQPGGGLTKHCKEKVSLGLRGFLKKKTWQPRSRALCAIDARGVSLRRLSLPASAKDDVQKVLRLQIESEFPLPPDALAWGYSRVQPSAAVNGKQELVVAALKKEVLEDYAQLFTSCGLTPIFTLAALARASVCPSSPTASFALLDIGRRQSELISFTDGAPNSIRILPWGGENLTRAIEESLGISLDEAEKLKVQWDEGPLPNGEVGHKVQSAIAKSLATLATAINATWQGRNLYLTGRAARYQDLPHLLQQRLPQVVECKRLEAKGANASTAAILGLKRASEAAPPVPPLVIRVKDSRTGDALARSGQSPVRMLLSFIAQGREIIAQPELRKWVRLGVILCVCSLCFPFAEALVLKPFLAKKLAAIEKDKDRLLMIDRELSFLKNLKKSQPPYLDALTVIANSIPPGTRFESVSMNRRGDVSLKGNMRDGQQVVDFRSKLIKSGFFSSVNVDEQTPSPDRQKMAVRLSAQWKPTGSRPPVKVEPLPPGGSRPGGMPMGFPGMMDGGSQPFFPPSSDMPPGMPPMRGGPGGPGGPSMPGPDAMQALRKAQKSKNSSRTISIGPNGEIITSSADTTNSSSADEKDKKSKDSNE